MKYLMLWFVGFLICGNAHPQSTNINSLRQKIQLAESDTARAMILSEMAYFYRLINPDSGIILSNQALELARKKQFPSGEASALNSLAQNFRIKGDLVATMSPLLEALRIAKANSLQPQLAEAYLSMGNTYVSLKDYPLAISYMTSSISIYRTLQNAFRESIAIANLGEAYMLVGNLDSARFLLDSASRFMNRVNYQAGLNFYRTRMAQLMFKLKKYDSAFFHIQKAEELSVVERNYRTRMMVAQLKAEYFLLQNVPDSARFYSESAFNLTKQFDYRWDRLASVNKLAEFYKGKDLEKAYFYAEMARSLNDSLYGPNIVNQLQRQIIRENELTQMHEAKLLASQNSLRQNLLLASLFLTGLILFWLYRNNLKDRKMNTALSKQKAEIEHQKVQVENTLQELKSAQAQLIQTEKMASLGELTAGIAHEIQNPLNFVNNFSEVSCDLLQEMTEEWEAGNTSEVKEIALDLRANLEKINHHGKRAESIVKSMLQHSRPSNGVAESVDVNLLCDECIRLAYQGYRSKNPSFNTILEVNYGENVGMVHMVSADIGRVLINIANNAFYAVSAKAQWSGGEYMPIVNVKTERKENEICIYIEDNGVGIPAKQLDKVFQPFFTTKATGQGTGLGLSISYDIIKAHKGKINLDSEEGQYTLFTISLPV